MDKKLILINVVNYIVKMSINRVKKIWTKVVINWFMSSCRKWESLQNYSTIGLREVGFPSSWKKMDNQQVCNVSAWSNKESHELDMTSVANNYQDCNLNCQ